MIAGMLALEIKGQVRPVLRTLHHMGQVYAIDVLIMRQEWLAQGMHGLPAFEISTAMIPWDSIQILQARETSLRLWSLALSSKSAWPWKLGIMASGPPCMTLDLIVLNSASGTRFLKWLGLSRA